MSWQCKLSNGVLQICCCLRSRLWATCNKESWEVEQSCWILCLAHTADKPKFWCEQRCQQILQFHCVCTDTGPRKRKKPARYDDDDFELDIENVEPDSTHHTVPRRKSESLLARAQRISMDGNSGKKRRSSDDITEMGTPRHIAQPDDSTATPLGESNMNTQNVKSKKKAKLPKSDLPELTQAPEIPADFVPKAEVSQATF